VFNKQTFIGFVLIEYTSGGDFFYQVSSLTTKSVQFTFYILYNSFPKKTLCVCSINLKPI